MPGSSVIELKLGPPGDVLDDYLNDRNRCSFIMGPIGSGKTTTSCQKILKLMIEQPPNMEGVRPSRWYAVRNTYADLFTTTIKDWMEIAVHLGRFNQGGRQPPHHILDFELSDGTKVKSEVIFIALDRPDAVKKLRGSQVTGFWLNETKELDKAIVDMADGRHGRYPSMAAGGVIASWHGMIGDTNAPDEDSWYYDLAEVVKPKGWKFFKQPGGVMRVKGEDGQDKYVLNPKAENVNNLPKGYYENLMEGKRKDWIETNLANEYGFVQEGKPVYPEYIDSYHCKPCGFSEHTALNIGMDFGLTPAAVFTQRSPMGQVRVIGEIVATRLGAKNFAREIKNYLSERGWNKAKFGAITGDPAGNQGQQADETMTVFKMLSSEGIEASPAPTNNFNERRETVADMLGKTIDGEPALIIDPSCKTLRKGLAGGYYFRRIQVVGSERYVEKPEKTPSSHVCEALQYDLLGQGISRETMIQPQQTLEMLASRPQIATIEYDPFG